MADEGELGWKLTVRTKAGGLARDPYGPQRPEADELVFQVALSDARGQVACGASESVTTSATLQDASEQLRTKPRQRQGLTHVNLGHGFLSASSLTM